MADITYIAIATGFVYLAAILDAWSRRVVGYAISRSIDARVGVLGSPSIASKATLTAFTPGLVGVSYICGECGRGAKRTIKGT